MTATNHALTGAIIGLVIVSPFALPIAFVSHFLLDAIPHFGWPGEEGDRLKGNIFRNYLLTEALICFLIVAVLSILQPTGWYIAVACAFLAASPDLFSYPRYASARAGKSWKPGRYASFASAIQWFERPIGAVVEVAWLIAAIFILANIL